MQACNLWYYGLTKNTIVDMMKHLLLVANDELKADIFVAITLMNNNPNIFQTLNFLPGDGEFHYYLYNWSTSTK